MHPFGALALVLAIAAPGAPTQAAPAAFVSTAYEVVLDRPAPPNAVAQYAPAIEGGQLSRTQFVQSLLEGTEFRSSEVNALYQHFLNRAADAAGLNLFVGQLGSGAPATQVAATIAGSAEYFQAAGGTNSGFIAKLFVDGAGRPADAAGLTFFMGALAQGRTREQVAATLLQSNEGSSHLLLVLYQNAMHRNGTPAGTTLLAAALGAIAAALPQPATRSLVR